MYKEKVMDLTKLTVIELESMAYRQVVLLEQTQRNLQILNAEITRRGKDRPEPVPGAVEAKAESV